MAIGKRGARELVRIADALHIPSDTYKFLPMMSVASRTAAALSETTVQYKRKQNKKEKKTRPHSTVSDNPHRSARRLVTKAKKKKSVAHWNREVCHISRQTVTTNVVFTFVLIACAHNHT